MPDLKTLGAAAACLYALLLLFKYAACQIVLCRMAAQSSSTDDCEWSSHCQQGITILQPILSGDPMLEKTLKANTANCCPHTIFYWLVDDNDSEARRIVQELENDVAAPATGLRSQLIICPVAAGDHNPKIAKLSFALPLVETEIVAVLDDDTVVPSQTIEQVAHVLTQADLATALPFYDAQPGLASAMVASFVNNNSALTYLPLLVWTNPVSINGMFYASRTATLRSLGAWDRISRQLCDDYALAKLFRSEGMTICQMTAPVRVTTSVRSLSHYFALMHRWFVFANVLVKDQPWAMQLLLFALLGLMPLLFWLALLGSFGGGLATLLFLMLLLVRYWAATDLIARIHRSFKLSGNLPHLSWWLSPLSELLQPIHWICSLLWPNIRWRRHLIKVTSDGRFRFLGAVDD